VVIFFALFLVKMRSILSGANPMAIIPRREFLIITWRDPRRILHGSPLAFLANSMFLQYLNPPRGYSFYLARDLHWVSRNAEISYNTFKGYKPEPSGIFPMPVKVGGPGLLYRKSGGQEEAVALNERAAAPFHCVISSHRAIHIPSTER
jgi:hypothetical protein